MDWITSKLRCPNQIPTEEPKLINFKHPGCSTPASGRLQIVPTRTQMAHNRVGFSMCAFFWRACAKMASPKPVQFVNLSPFLFITMIL